MSRSRRFTASLELPLARSSSTSPRPPKSDHPLNTKTQPAASPVEQTPSNAVKGPPPPPVVEAGKEKKQAAQDLLELKEELARLREKEAVLSHLLSLEKEERVKAEQLVEVERMSSLQWEHRLHLLKKHKSEEEKLRKEKVGLKIISIIIYLAEQFICIKECKQFQICYC